MPMIWNVIGFMWQHSNQTAVVVTINGNLHSNAPRNNCLIGASNHIYSMNYRQVFNISRTIFQPLKYSHTVLLLSLPNPLKQDVKSRMKM